MNKRDFIKTGLLGIAGLSVTKLKGNNFLHTNGKNGFSMPELPYSITDISSVFSEDAFLKHYTQHYTSFNKSLNKQLNQLVFKPKNVREILTNANQFNQSTINNACGYYNHRMFFRLINPININTTGSELKKEITKTFGSEDKLNQEFAKKAHQLKTNGWLWLILKNNKLQVVATQNNLNPLLSNIEPELRGFPILGIDMWDHAYKPNYGNNRHSYMLAVLKNLNWGIADRRYQRAKKLKLA